jgi:hypothetical protein
LGSGTRDPGSGKNLSIPDPGVTKAPDLLIGSARMALTDISLSGDGKPGHNINIANGDFPKKREDFNV